jgi:DNA polymerase I
VFPDAVEGQKERPLLFIWIRGEDGKRYRVKVTDFKPYFYVPKWMVSPANNLFSSPEIQEKGLINFGDEDFWQITTFVPGQVVTLRNRLNEVYHRAIREADVLFTLRYLIDKKIRNSVLFTPPNTIVPLEEDLAIKLRKVYVDIEIWGSTLIKPRKFRRDEWIKAISAYDNYEKIYYTWFIDDASPVKYQETENWKIFPFTSTKDMMNAFFDWILERDPDVITGFNVDFDLILIREQALVDDLVKKLDYFNSLWDTGLGHVKGTVKKKYRIRGRNWNREGLRFDGREVIDIRDLIRMISLTQLQEYSLEYCSKKFIDKTAGKIKWKGQPIAPHLKEVWKESPTTVLEYNKHDVELSVQLDEKNDLIDTLDMLRKTVGVTLEDAYSQQRMIDTEALRRRTSPLLSKFRPKEAAKLKEAYEGATVFEPK